MSIMRRMALWVVSISILGGAQTPCFAIDINFSVCEQVSVQQLSSISQTKLFPIEQERGCQWSNKPSGIPYF